MTAGMEFGKQLTEQNPETAEMIGFDGSQVQSLTLLYRGEVPNPACILPYRGKVPNPACSLPYRGEVPNPACTLPYRGEVPNPACTLPRRQNSLALQVPDHTGEKSIQYSP